MSIKDVSFDFGVQYRVKINKLENEILELKDGRILSRNFTPVFIDGKKTAQIWNYRDITLRINYDKGLEFQSTKYKSIIQNMNLGLMEVDNNDIIFGNFIADSVKGKSYQRYRKDIVTGILLHRKIDSFTDNHSIFKSSREIISSDFGKFSGIFIDIYYENMERLNAKDTYFFDRKYFFDFYKSEEFKTTILMVFDNETDKAISFINNHDFGWNADTCKL